MIPALAVLAGSSLCLADLPAVFDRVPENAAVAGSLKNAQATRDKLDAIVKSLGIDESPMAEIDAVLNLEGVSKTGSVAFFGMQKPKDAKAEPSKDDADTDEMDIDELDGMNAGPVSDMDEYVLVPVSNYEAFLKSISAKPVADGISMFDARKFDPDALGEENQYVRAFGDGYALMSDSKDPLMSIKPTTGSLKAWNARLGATGKRIVDKCDAVMLVNLDELRDEMQENLAEGKREMQNAPIPGAAKMMGDMFGVMDAFVRDGQLGIVGMNSSDAGVWLDMGINFKEGSVCAGKCNAKGSVTNLLNGLPVQPFLFVTAMDTGSPLMREMMSFSTRMNEDMMAAMGEEAQAGKKVPQITNPFSGMSKLAEKADGMSMIMGANPGGMMGGLFNNTVMFIATDKPEEYQSGLKEMVTQSNGASMMGVTYKSDYAAGQKEIAGKKVDSWSMTISADPNANNPSAQQMIMMQNMVFGGKMGGYNAAVPGGVLSTLSRNELMMKAALENVAEGKGLGKSEQIKMLQGFLPEDRSMEMYMGIKELADMATGFMGMMGQAPELNLPDQVTPIAMGLTMTGGGAQFRAFVPTDTMQAIKSIADSFQSMRGPAAGDDMDMMEEGEDEDGEAPKF
jgi:hypothetical protein